MLYIFLYSSNKHKQNAIIATIQDLCQHAMKEREKKKNDEPAYNIYPGRSVMTVSLPVIFLPLQPAVTEVNPESVVVCVWTFETNGHGQQSRDNPSRLCKYQSACLEQNVNALI